MANEIIFNLDLNGIINPSNYLFPKDSSGTIYFRPYKDHYLSTWSGISSINIEFMDNDKPSNRYSITLNNSDIIAVGNEQLMKLDFPVNMLKTATLYKGIVKINNSSSRMMELDISVYESSSTEIVALTRAILKYEDTFYDYLRTVKTDKLNIANGVAILDSNRKILESYLPSHYKAHIDSKIRNAEPHKFRLNTQGRALYFDTDDGIWKLVDGQPSVPGNIPPTITVDNGTVTIKHDRNTVVTLQKWDEGDRDILYFQTKGRILTGNTFKVTKYGIYTLYYKNAFGEEYVVTFEVKETDIPFPTPKVTVSKGIVSVVFNDESLVDIKKWEQGSQQVPYFQNGGNDLIDGQFIATTPDTYTIYYKLKDGREFVTYINVEESDLPQDIMPTLYINDGKVVVTYDVDMTVIDSKWDILERDALYFQTFGTPIVNNTFNVTISGKHTLYFKTSKNKEYVIVFNVLPSQLHQEPIVNLQIVNGVVTVLYPFGLNVSINKWDKEIKGISYFQANGHVFTNNTFIIQDSGMYTLYYKTSENKEYIKVFEVTATNLPPQILPSYEKRDGFVFITVQNESLYTQNFYAYQDVNIDYFRDGNGRTVVDWKIPITTKGIYTHYYKVQDGRDGIVKIEITNADLPHGDPMIEIINGLVKITHPPINNVITQRYALGDKDIQYFQSNGTGVVDNKFYVTQAGEYSLYYLLDNTGEYVKKFTVTLTDLEKPVIPPTITIVNGRVGISYPPSTDVILQKWDIGILGVPYFKNNGNEFTGLTFQVANAGDYTLYYQLRNEKEYVVNFKVEESNLKPQFIPPTITIVRGKVTLEYNPAMNVTLTKWVYGIEPLSYFDANGNVVVNNTFNVSQVGTHSLFTELDGQYKYVMTFNVTADQLPEPEIPPIFQVVDGVVTVIHDASTIVSKQKWAIGNQTLQWFETNGTEFTGNTFTVELAGVYSYWYENSYGEKYVHTFNVTEVQLPYYDPIIEVYDALMTVQFTSLEQPTLVKFDSGSRDKTYFNTNGIIIVNNQAPITVAGGYTLYWKLPSGRDFVKTFNVSANQIVEIAKPTVIPTGTTVNVTYTPEVESFVSIKKWGEGEQEVVWFDTNGHIVTSNSFEVTNVGVNTYYYKYRTRGYTIPFFIWEDLNIVPKYKVARIMNNPPSGMINKQQWAHGSQDIAFFNDSNNASEINDFTGDRFDLDIIGDYTIYTQLTSGSEHISVFNVVGENLLVPKLYTDIVTGLVTVSYKLEAPITVKIYGVKIDTTNPSPTDALTYTDDAVGFTPALGNNGNFQYGSWQDKFPFNQIKPCVLKDGVVNYYLNPNDYTKKIDGSPADIVTGGGGDVMIEFPKIYWKFETVGTDLFIRYSSEKVDAGYKCLAHTRGIVEKDKIYIGAYFGHELSGKLRSLSGLQPEVSRTLSSFRTLAQANGNGYEQSTYYQILMLQVLFTIMFKSRDSQTALGRGYVDGHTSVTITGGTNTRGMFYGETTGKQQMKFCGIEDFWGNVNRRFDGLVTSANRSLLIGNGGFNDTGAGYGNYGVGSANNLTGYITQVQGGTETGFITKAVGGSNSSYYAGLGTIFPSTASIFGGAYYDNSDSGAFTNRISYNPNTESTSYSTSISYY